jgi:hypothetical protein
MARDYKYLVHYIYQTGQGRTFLTVSQALDTEEAIAEAERHIVRNCQSQGHSFDAVAIVNIISLRA